MATKKLNKTGIEYGDLNWNFYPGCLHKPQSRCPLPNCWAEAMWKRRVAAAAKKGIVLHDFHHPALIPELLLSPLSVKKPSTILVNFMGDLMGNWVDPEQWVSLQEPTTIFSEGIILKDAVFDVLHRCPQHRFLFLTKNPEGYKRWGDFPDNAWLGVSVCNVSMMGNTLESLSILHVSHKWLSIEPLLDWRLAGTTWSAAWMKDAGISWVVLGAQSQPTFMPDLAWVEEIVTACDRAGIRVWLKNNLMPLFELKRGKTYVEYRLGVDIDLFYPVIPNRPERRAYRQEVPV